MGRPPGRRQQPSPVVFRHNRLARGHARSAAARTRRSSFDERAREECLVEVPCRCPRPCACGLKCSTHASSPVLASPHAPEDQHWPNPPCALWGTDAHVAPARAAPPRAGRRAPRCAQRPRPRESRDARNGRFIARLGFLARIGKKLKDCNARRSAYAVTINTALYSTRENEIRALCALTVERVHRAWPHWPCAPLPVPKYERG